MQIISLNILVTFFHTFHIFFLTTIYIIARSSKVSIVYVINGDIKEFATIGIVGTRGIIWADSTTFMPSNCFIILFLEIDFLKCIS